MVDYKVMGSRIKKQRQEKGITQEQLAEKVEITTVYLSKIENGHVRPTIELLESICEILRLDIGDLFSNISIGSAQYQNERIVQLFNACSPNVKLVALELMEKLSKL